ncbi:MAG: flippase-like domain-containing protein, partial [Saprospiraceae bacterium]|nr:flippase-like domain-containing protein [Saprospiraceae bacterium]
MSSKKKIKEQESVLNSVSGTKVILPMVIGLGVIGLLIYNQLDPEEFLKIKWNARVWFWLGCAIFIYVLRHIFYSYRLKILSDHEFSFKHAVELVFIWEFASSISPTSIGGSAVAVFFLSQEKISAAKAVSIVLYTVIVDTLFFLVSLVILFIIFGPPLIRPDMTSMLEGYGITFILVWFFMLLYGVLLTWGLFRPRIIKRILMTIARIPFIRKFRLKLYQIGEDVVITSKEIRNRPLSF